MPRGLLLLAALVAAPACAEGIGAADAARLEHLVAQDCGACHGMTMQGGLGTPLTAEALRGKPVDSLVATIMGGRPGTAMPPWHQFMNEQEARWMVELLQAGKHP